MHSMFARLLKIFEFFTKLPKPVQMQIIQAIVNTLTFAFRWLFRNKNTDNKNDDLKTASDEAVPPQQWHGTALAVQALIPSMPSIYSKKKKEEFAASVIDLVKSNDFINELNSRIETIHVDDEESYVALCSIEAKKLIIEMMEKIKN